MRASCPAATCFIIFFICVLLQQLVDLLHARARSGRDPAAARAVDQLRVAALRRRHREDHRLDAVELPVVHVHVLAPACRCPGIMPSSDRSDPILRIWRSWSSRSSSANSERLAASARALGLVLVDVLLGALDQRQHVAHAEDARGHAVGVELLELVELLADGRELDRLAGDRAHRERRAAARVAVELRQDHAVEVDRVDELLGDVDGVLAGHRVEHQQHVVRLDVALRTRTSSSISSLSTCRRPAVSTITTSRPCDVACLDAPARDVDRVAAGAALEDRHVDLAAERLELLDGGRALQVAGHERRLQALLRQQPRELAGGRRLARALQAAEQDDRRRLGGERRASSPARAEQRRQLLVDDLHDLLAGRQARQHVRARPRARAPRRRTS